MKKSNFKNLFKKDFLFNQLMQIYSTLLVAIIVLLVILMGLYFAGTNYKKIEYNAQQTTDQLISSMDQKKEVVSNILYELTSDTSKFASMREYIVRTPREYFNYTFDYFEQTGRDIYFPNTLTNIMNSYPEIESLDIVLNDVDERLHVSRENKRGTKVVGAITKSQHFSFIRPINEEVFSSPIGMIYVTFNRNNLLSEYSDFGNELGQENLVISKGGDILFSSGTSLTTDERQMLVESIREQASLSNQIEKKYFITKTETTDGSMIVVMQSRSNYFKELFKEIFLILLIAGGVIFILLYTLHRTFNKYSRQVQQIVDVTNEVSLGNFDQEIAVDNVQQELKEISIAINQMIKNINHYIHDLYVLEIKQKDAHMNALQAQINPHFMSNTLEYIRMYALSQGQEELADVVYAFSALLRNNVSMENITTLEQEIEFCEKYVYLYQMRFPDKFAYHFSLADEIKDTQIPKFILQPIIENYFMHGIDYSRSDNAISLKAYLADETLTIDIVDNGKGATKEELEKLLNRFGHEQQAEVTSIGMVNIDERLRNYFGSTYHMKITSEKNQFFMVHIRFKKDR